MIPVGTAPLFVNRACFCVLSAVHPIAREASSFMVEGIVAPEARARVGVKLGGASHQLGEAEGMDSVRSWPLSRHHLDTSRTPARGPRKRKLRAGSHADEPLRRVTALGRLRVGVQKKLMPSFPVPL